MELERFLARLSALSGDDLARLAAAIEQHHRSVSDELATWEALMCIDDALRRRGRSRRAARAAHDAARAVQEAALRARIALPDAQVTRVAREAALVARGLVAGVDAHAAVDLLLRDWSDAVHAA